MNSQHIQEKSGIKQSIKEFFTLGNVPEQQQEEILKKIEKAISLNLAGRFFDLLSENDRRIINGKMSLSTEELFSFISEKISKEDFQKSLNESVEEVVKNFLEKI